MLGHLSNRTLLLMLVLLAASARADAGTLSGPPAITAPQTPIAGQPWTIVLPLVTFGSYDLDPTTVPEVSVEGSEILVTANIECNQIFCDFSDQNYLRVEMPALAAGEYLLRVVDESRFEPIQVSIVDGAPLPARRPVDGFWSDPRRPGSGLVLQRQGDILALGVFFLDRGAPFWKIDSPRLNGSSAVAAPEFVSLDSNLEACVTCPAVDGVRMFLSDAPLRLEFESDRRVRVQVGDDDPRYGLVSLPFGGNYVSTLLVDSVDDEFGPLPLPNLQGRWLFDHPSGPRALEFEQAIESEGLVRFVAGELELECRSASPELRAGCRVTGAADVLIDAFSLLGNISGTRMTFDQASEVPEATVSFQAHRLDSR